jgi:hypothetical protein
VVAGGVADTENGRLYQFSEFICVIDVEVGDPSPFGMLRYAENYRVAAEQVIGDCDPLESSLLMPAYNLLAQSIELSLKAYLLSRGMENKRLRGPLLGHNLSGLVAESESLGFGDLVLLDDLDRELIASLSKYYETHEFRYIRTGPKELPYWSLISPLANRLTDELCLYCLALLVGEEAARRRIETFGKFDRGI